MQMKMSKHKKEPNKKTVQIKIALLEKGLTYQEIANAVGVTRDAVSKVVNQHSKSKRIANEIEKITGVQL